MKRKLYEEGALPTSSDGPKKVIKKATATVAMATQGTPTVITVPTAQVIATSGIQAPAPSQPPLKKQKTAGKSSGTLLHHSDIYNIIIVAFKKQQKILKALWYLDNLMSCPYVDIFSKLVQNSSSAELDHIENIRTKHSRMQRLLTEGYET